MSDDDILGFYLIASAETRLEPELSRCGCKHDLLQFLAERRKKKIDSNAVFDPLNPKP